ncbi:MAG: hypothetical protein GKS00_27055 [Alphaproteobacteria bacterium]|nr:hypothetical protein [Alphaproteobacteria bacterium]
MRYGFSAVAQASMWIAIVILALIMQVMPLLLILTLFNMAIGVSSATILVIIPIALFGSIIVACTIAERRRRSMLPAPISAQAGKPHPDTAMRHTAACMLPYLRRSRFF